MRDVGRVKNKFELKLDSNQVFSLFAGVAVYSALIFVLGVVVGRSRKPPEDPNPVATVALPDATPTPAKRIEDRLAVAQPKATEEPEIPIGDVMTHLENATPVNAVPTAKSSPTPKSVATVAKAETPKETPKATEVAKTETPKPTPKQLLGEPTPGPTSAKSSPEGAGNFTLQVVAYNEKTQADTAVASLKSKGFDAYAVTAQVPGKGTIHRVRVGRYGTRGAAETAAKDLAAASPGTKPLVVSFE